MKVIVKALIVTLLAISYPIDAAELEPLKQFINRKPSFLSDKNDTELIASRCSALYLVLSSRTETVPKSKDLKGIATEYADLAGVYDEVREVISKVTKSPQNQQKEFAQSYADTTLKNWKQSNDIFKGIVNDDLDVCRDNYAYFKKLAVNLSQETKK
jgi:hypothetical protein